jgi:hypothetical protein
MKTVLIILIVSVFAGCNKEVVPKNINLIRPNEIVINIEKDNNLIINDNEIIIPEFKR